MSEVEERVGRVRTLLMELHDELRWFLPKRRAKARRFFRKSFYTTDLCYITTLLAIVQNESHYKMWKREETPGMEKRGLKPVLELPRWKRFRRPLA